MNYEKRWPRWIGWGLALLISVGVYVAIVMAFVGCRSPHPAAAGLPEPLRGAKPVELEDALQAPLGGRMLALLDQQVHGNVRMLHGRTACAGVSPLPYIVVPSNQPAPRVGRQWTCDFVTSACSLPPEPDWLAWIMLSLRAPDGVPLDLTPYGNRGCWLLVNPDQLVAVPPGFEAPSGSMLSRAPGKGAVTFRWTPELGMAGQMVWMQFVVLSPRGFLSSYAIELTVGS